MIDSSMVQRMLEQQRAGASPRAVVLLTGPIGGGKSTVSKLMQGFGWTPASLAYPLKRVAAEIFGLEESEVFGTREQKAAPTRRYHHLSGRAILDHLGMQGFRAINSDVFVDASVRAIRQAAAAGVELLVIDDVRLLNEVAGMREAFPCVEVWALEVLDEREAPVPNLESEQEQKAVAQGADRVLRANRGDVGALLGQAYDCMRAVDKGSAAAAGVDAASALTTSEGEDGPKPH